MTTMNMKATIDTILTIGQFVNKIQKRKILLIQDLNVINVKDV